jgi:hypothetical protein
MGQKALAKPSYITHSAIIFAPRAKLFFVLHPLALLLFFLKVVAQHIPALKSSSPVGNGAIQVVSGQMGSKEIDKYIINI